MGAGASLEREKLLSAGCVLPSEASLPPSAGPADSGRAWRPVRACTGAPGLEGQPGIWGACVGAPPGVCPPCRSRGSSAASQGPWRLWQVCVPEHHVSPFLEARGMPGVAWEAVGPPATLALVPGGGGERVGL